MENRVPNVVKKGCISIKTIVINAVDVFTNIALFPLKRILNSCITSVWKSRLIKQLKIWGGATIKSDSVKNVKEWTSKMNVQMFRMEDGWHK